MDYRQVIEKVARKLLLEKRSGGKKPYLCIRRHKYGPNIQKRAVFKIDNKKYMSDVGSLRFVAETAHPRISYIIGVLGVTNTTLHSSMCTR